jgi:rhodanese-related sulfurtransferase
MCGRPSSTIGFERRFNPVIQLSEEAFRAQAAVPPARPLNMNVILETNRGAADYAWVRAQGGMSDVPSVGVDEAPSWLKKHPDALVLDVREPWEYTAGHVPGAVSLPQADLALHLDRVPRDRDVLVVCESGNRSLRASGFLRDVGYERVTNLAGGTGGWRRAGLPVEKDATSAGG